MLLLTLLAAGLLQSCKIEDNDIGTEILPESDKINLDYFEIPLDAQTILQDTFGTSNKTANFLLGTVNDAYFGVSNASFITKAVITGAINFDTQPIIDSVVLCLPYANALPTYGNRGKLGGLQRVKVYRLPGGFAETGATNAYQAPQFRQLFGEKIFYPNVVDKVNFTFPTDTNPISEDPQLRIRLNTTAVNFFADTTIYSTAAIFSDALRGLLVETELIDNNAGNGCIMRFSINNPFTKIIAYYREPDGLGGFIRGSLIMPITTAVPRVQMFSHNRTATDVQTALATGLNYPRLFTQAMASVKTKVLLPNLKLLPQFADTVNFTYIINKAEIVMPLEDNSVTTNFTKPSQLNITQPSPAEQYANWINPPSALLRDDSLGIAPVSSGTFVESENAYSFLLSAHLSAMYTGRVKSNFVYIQNIETTNKTLPDVGVRPERVVFANTANKKPMLKVFYSKIAK